MASINDLATAAIASSSAAATSATEGGAGEAATTRGAFVVLEGLDRSGKTTQVKLLEQRFVEEGRPVKVMRFPGELSRLVSGSCTSGVGYERDGRQTTVGLSCTTSVGINGSMHP